MKPHMRRIVEFLGDVGATDVLIQNGGKHPRIAFQWQGRERFYVVPRTPSDRRGELNAISEIRHMLGLVETEKRVGEQRERRHRPPRAAPPELSAPIAHPALDWRDTLAIHPVTQATLQVRLHRAWWALWEDIKARHGAAA